MEPLIVCSAAGFGFLVVIFLISCLFLCATTNSAKKKLLIICQLQIAAVMMRIVSHLIQFNCLYHIISTRFLNSCLALGLVEPVARLYVVSKRITRLSGDINKNAKKPAPPLPLYITGLCAIVLFWTDAIITIITDGLYGAIMLHLTGQFLIYVCLYYAAGTRISVFKEVKSLTTRIHSISEKFETEQGARFCRDQFGKAASKTQRLLVSVTVIGLILLITSVGYLALRINQLVKGKNSYCELSKEEDTTIKLICTEVFIFYLAYLLYFTWIPLRDVINVSKPPAQLQIDLKSNQQNGIIPHSTKHELRSISSRIVQ